MRISDAKKLINSVAMYNMETAAAGKRHNDFVVPFLLGDPGVGKTSILRQVADELGLDYYQVILAQFDAGELAGLSVMNKEYDAMIRLRPFYLPPVYIKGDDEQVRYHAGLFNLDELPQAFLANQNIASQMVNEYRVGEHEISPGMTICCTGNKPENKAGTTTMPMHLRDRLTFIEIEANVDDWLAYAAKKGIHPLIRTYIREKPRQLSNFQVGQDANPTPRSWEKVSHYLAMDLDPHIRSETIAGQIGKGDATEFEAYFRVFDKMPKVEDVLAEPEKAPLFTNKEADILYTLLASLADHTTEKNVGQAVKYINRLENQEFSVAYMMDLLNRSPELQANKTITEWKLNSGRHLII